MYSYEIKLEYHLYAQARIALPEHAIFAEIRIRLQ